MIIDLDNFVHDERPYWLELETFLDRLEMGTSASLSLQEAQRLHYLYQRASGDLARLMTFSAEEEVRNYLENLVSRAYCEIHETPQRPHRLTPVHWFVKTFPRTFRKHLRAFQMSLLLTIVGALFGAMALSFDDTSKELLLPFEHLLGDPSERVAQEELAAESGEDGGMNVSFSAYLMRNNIKVSLFALSAGLSWGFGTIVILFYNGVILGAVMLDYLRAGEGVFLAGWLLPHGSVEIPAILVGGQAGLVLAHALIGWGQSEPLGVRMRQIGPSLVTLAGGLAVMLVWAGLIESFLSQTHGPSLYPIKIAFGTLQLIGLFAFLMLAGRRPDDPNKPPLI